LDTSDSEELVWPLPGYNPGPRDHLHAIGVISVTFASFQASLDALYRSQAVRQNIPEALADLSYFALSEDKRIEAIKIIFATSEKDAGVIAAVENLLAYFRWCRDCRNHILHAERFPPSLGGNPAFLYLVKKMGKQSPKYGYMKFSIERLRYIADKIRKGVVQSAEIHLHLRVRGQPVEKVSAPYKPYVSGPPAALEIPKYIEPTEKP